MTDLSHIEAVLFDMDGTLIQHTWRLSQITDALFEKFAPALAPLTCDEFYAAFWPKNADLWYMMVEGVIDGDTAQEYSYTNTLRALNKDSALAPAMVACWTDLVLQEAVPFAQTRPVLQSLRPHFVTGIVTNGFKTMQRAKLKKHRLDQAVDFCLVSEEVGFHKPDARLFQEALKQAGHIPPEQAIFVGDNLETDIKGAQNAGIQPVFIAPKHNQTPPQGVIIITQLSDLLTLLPRLNCRG